MRYKNDYFKIELNAVKNRSFSSGKPMLMRDDWKNVFEPAEIAESIRRIT